MSHLMRPVVLTRLLDCQLQIVVMLIINYINCNVSQKKITSMSITWSLFLVFRKTKYWKCMKGITWKEQTAFVLRSFSRLKLCLHAWKSENITCRATGVETDAALYNFPGYMMEIKWGVQGFEVRKRSSSWVQMLEFWLKVKPEEMFN